jgi:DUF4097 and DUF4098 domain-containing protein YvlB
MTLTTALVCCLGTLASPGDTLIDVREGDRLVLQGFEGYVEVETWDRSTVHAESEAKEARAFHVRRSGNRVELVLGGGGGGDEHELRLTVPAWLDLEFSGEELEADIRDLDGDVDIRNIQGDLTLRNLGGVVEAYSVEGTIEAYNLTGSARLRTGNDDLQVDASSASLELETMDGEIHLTGIESRRISARSTGGEIDFSGRILEGGEYAFFSHDGDIQLGLVGPVNLDATVLAYEGELESDFPIRASGYRSGESLAFTVGTGGARLVVETFSGEIQLRRGS